MKGVLPLNTGGGSRLIFLSLHSEVHLRRLSWRDGCKTGGIGLNQDSSHFLHFWFHLIFNVGATLSSCPVLYTHLSIITSTIIWPVVTTMYALYTKQVAM